VAFASWWDGGYDGRYDNNGYYSRKSSGSTTTTSRQADPGYESPGEGGTSPGCGTNDCYDTPPTTSGCGTNDCYDTPPTTSGCGTNDCYDTPPTTSGCQADCDTTPPPTSAPPAPPPPCGQPCGSAPPPPPPPPPLAPIYGCENSDLAGTALAVHKTTTPPEGTPVAPGDEILVDLTWPVTDFVAPVLHKVLDCIYVNGVFVPPLSLGVRDVANDGHFTFRYVVPLDAPVGGTICDQGFVSGPTHHEDYGREVSNVVCFPICAPSEQPPPPPAVEETTTTTAPEEEAQPYATDTKVERLFEEAPPAEAPVVLPAVREVLPRTGSGPDGARVAAAALASLVLIRRRLRRS
jgi:hypothetical protein